MSSQDHLRSDLTTLRETPGRDRLAKFLMCLLGVSTLAAFANAAVAYPSVPADRAIVEAWRMLAYPVFGGLFILLGLFPRRIPGLWELVFYQKAGVAIFLAFFVTAAAGPKSTIIAVDGSLAGVTLLCYVLTQGWRAWRTER
jgi:hypothetical protein